MKLSTVSCFLLMSIFPLTSYAWNALGHMVIADIAYQHLTPTARAQVDNLTAEFSKEYPQMTTFLDLSYWPDTLQSQKIETYAHWHYIDNPLITDNTQTNSIIDSDNAVWAVNKIEKIIKNTHANPYERVRFLSFLIHITADLHQPLHTVSFFSEKYPEGDRGGNLYKVKYKNQPINLHQLWDRGLGVFAGASTKAEAQQLSTTIMQKYPESFFGKKLYELNPVVWAEEGMVSANTYVYSTAENEPINAAYEERGKQLVQEESALGGCRLAMLLNQLLG